jgi:hypothetical protein
VGSAKMISIAVKAFRFSGSGTAVGSGGIVRQLDTLAISGAIDLSIINIEMQSIENIVRR